VKVLSVVGARPQFIKAAPVSRALYLAGYEEYLVHTGQHYDRGMSQVFFDELSVPEPNINLNVGSGPHGQQTGRMLAAIEEVLLSQKPDWVLVYGDTNSTLAGALAAVKLHIPVAHVEAGLRSFNREMPEEHNRVLTDHCADLLFCPTQTAIDHLNREGITDNVHWVGDTMYDAVLHFEQLSQTQSRILSELSLVPNSYLLATIHRPYNTDITVNLKNILAAFLETEETVVFPAHPRTRQKIADCADLADLLGNRSNIKLIEPVGYLDMLALQKNARIILTDSGGIQKEAYFLAVPCITLRPETEWIETVETGWNVLVGADKASILQHIHAKRLLSERTPFFGDGNAASRIAQHLVMSAKVSK
jgi:UDP-GlcNAc3NAcA epimerase